MVQISEKSHYFLVAVKAAVGIPVTIYYFQLGLPTCIFLWLICNCFTPFPMIGFEMFIQAAMAECLCLWQLQPEKLHEWTYIYIF